MAKYCACRRFSQSCTAPNRITGGAAAATGSAALSQMPCENAAKLAAVQIRSTAAIDSRPIALRRHESRPTSNSVSTMDRIASAVRVERSRSSPSPVINWAMTVAMISTPGMTESNGVGKTSPPPVTVAPITTMRFRIASGATVPFSAEAALMVRTVPCRP